MIGASISLLALFCATATARRDVSKLAAWAKENGVVMHEHLKWKQHDTVDADSDINSNDEDNDDNIGIELTEAVDPGTIILRVPRNIVFDAYRIRNEYEKESPTKVAKALQLLKEKGFSQHAEGFFIFLKVLQCCQDGDTSFWNPYIQSLPRKFVTFSELEKSCLPYYAKYIAEYQDLKCKAFHEAALESGLIDAEDPDRAKWAFCAVGSRFWNGRSTEEATKAILDDANNKSNDSVDTGTSELVPVGDMFNHREPPNVKIAHERTDEGDYVNFIYLGNNGDGDEKDLYISYGQPSNPHRFLGIFGFVPYPVSIPNVWSHIAYASNPFCADVEQMVFRTSDGHISKHCWDSVLYALFEPKHPPDQPPQFKKEHHQKWHEHTSDVLRTHIEKQLEELTALGDKIKALDFDNENVKGQVDNIGLITKHNGFLTDVFKKALVKVEAGFSGKDD